MRVECEMEEILLENDEGYEIEGIAVCCGECLHTEEAFGTGADSVRYACKQLNENCPEGENNFYAVPGVHDNEEGE